MNTANLLQLLPLELATSRAQSSQAAVLLLILHDPGVGRRDPRLRGLRSKPAWSHMPLIEAGVGAEQTYIHTQQCMALKSSW